MGWKRPTHQGEEGKKGEIVIRGDNVMRGYFANPEANERAFAFGWFRSGDEGFYRLDDRGRKFFFITGRIKELIIRGGVNISPFEIDELLMGVAGKGHLVGFDVVEVNPYRDPSGRTAQTSVRLMIDLLGAAFH